MCPFNSAGYFPFSKLGLIEGLLSKTEKTAKAACYPKVKFFKQGVA